MIVTVALLYIDCKGNMSSSEAMQQKAKAIKEALDECTYEKD